MMKLSEKTLDKINGSKIKKPGRVLLDLPERVLQFGTGVLLRGLCDYFIHTANTKGIFNGRIVVVKSTDGGDVDDFTEQDNLYTICVRGLDNGRVIEENIICSAISRVVSAKKDWQSVLGCVRNKDLNIIISNTTEIGIQYVEESIKEGVPASFPGKLLAVLYSRYVHFSGSEGSGMVVIPTELISNNGEKLRSIILQLAGYNRMEKEFIHWIESEVTFCNSLVDRIVTKDPGTDLLEKIQDELGYHDDLLAMCENYKLWAIEGNEQLNDVLQFASHGNGAFIETDIEKYKALKLHLLNGTHTLSASLAFLAGFDTVKEAMEDNSFAYFVEHLMRTDIASAIPYPAPSVDIDNFSGEVLDRFRNPFLRHRWINITLQNTMKMRMRNVPVILHHAHLNSAAPEFMAAGFAAFILFMKPVKLEKSSYYGSYNGNYYLINDEQASFYHSLWNDEKDIEIIVKKILTNKDLWGTDLTTLKVFHSSVLFFVKTIINDGAGKMIQGLISAREALVR